jgi:16S rRNA (guanine527-N7)-methyltransferase
VRGKNMEEKIFKEKLNKNAEAIGVLLNEVMLEQFYQYKNSVIEWNEKINLTAITDDFEFIVKHFIDSLTINKYIEKDKTIIDIGTGAGFPGIPIKIINKSNKMVLFDSLNKRLKVLDNIIDNLKLQNIETLHGRAEETFKNKEYREKYDIAVSRAVASLNVLVELMIPAIKVGGICICMKGNNAEQEIIDAKKAIKELGGEILKVEKIVLPELNLERNIVVIKKIKQTPKQYPRKPGTPQKLPIR